MGSKQGKTGAVEHDCSLMILQNSVFLRHLASALHLDIVIIQMCLYDVLSDRFIYRLTLHCKFGCAVSVKGAPVRLVSNGTVLSLALWLPWLIKGLKVEDVDAPRGDAADCLLPVVLGALEAGNSSLVLGSIGGPSYFVLDMLITTP